MKIEPRGKYAGIKVHLDGEEVEKFLRWVKGGDTAVINYPIQFAGKLAKQINSLLSEHPNLLKDRTEEEIKAALLKEQEEATKKLEKIKHGEKWNG